MPATEAILLAGGLGTRLRSAVPDLPKCMAPVNNQPFLYYVMQWLQQQGIRRFIFSLGYKHEVIIEWLQTHYPQLDKVYAIETTPLGTGGAIQLAGSKAITKDVVVVNGDTLFNININQLYQFYQQQQANCALALKPMTHFSRYGTVALNNQQRITAFTEKQYCDAGLINGGVYLLKMQRFLSLGLPATFSFEKDYLEAFTNTEKITGLAMHDYFIDIGIPEDYNKAQHDLQP
ncbi:MAG: nucleotidyltransferase family protein [Flavihumibacter sp.]|nr:nucleotidyltransferase family protein [Flavihumibacter sp.]